MRPCEAVGFMCAALPVSGQLGLTSRHCPQNWLSRLSGCTWMLPLFPGSPPTPHAHGLSPPTSVTGLLHLGTRDSF